jgi:uncharacterized protein (TIGR02594 family)
MKSKDEYLKSVVIAAAIASAFFTNGAWAHGAFVPSFNSETNGQAASRGGSHSQARTGSSVIAEAAHWIGSRNMTGMAGPWCADAVSFWLRRTGHRPLANRMVSSALAYGPRLPGPQVGALAVIGTRRGWAGHVGLVEGVEPNGSIRLISGNWGHRVAESVISRRAVIAFVRVE